MNKNRLGFLILTILSFTLMSAVPISAEAMRKIDSFDKEIEAIRLGEKHKGVYVQSIKKVPMTAIHDRQVVVQLTPGTSLDFPDYEEVQADPLLLLRIPVQLDYHQELRRIQSMEGVESASPNIIYTPMYKPSDAYYRSYQDYLKKIGMEQAWDVTKGTKEVSVAVIDSGVLPSHEDLQGRLTAGFDAFTNGPVRSDGAGHGTHVTGILAANTNSRGGIGVAPGIRVIPIKAGDDRSVYTSAVLRGIDYAVDNHADVINMSFGSFYNDPAVQEKLLEAYDAGITLVAASGNEETNVPAYPAGYPWVIAVGATDTTSSSPRHAPFSNIGSHIDVAAPGVDIFSTSYDGTYGVGSGTSYSAPIVSGLAALLISKHRDWKPADVEYALQASSDQLLRGESNEQLGFGQVNGTAALRTGLKSLEEDSSAWDLSKTGPLQIGSLSESLNYPSDRDLYKWNAEAPGQASLRLHHPAGHIDPVLVVYREMNGSIYEQDYIDEHGQGIAETLTFQAGEGTYYIGVYDYYENWSAQPYTLTLDQELPQAERISGTDRFETAVEISKQGWQDGAGSVLIATGFDFPDALSASPLAYQLDAPILLTRPDRLGTETKREIGRLGASSVYIIGGINAVSANVEKEIRSQGLQVTRVAGGDRYETSVEIAEELKLLLGRSLTSAVVSSGRNFPDALASAPYAARHSLPILLTKEKTLSPEVKEITDTLQETIVIGGTGVVNDSVVRMLPNPVRYAGENRFDTAVRFIEGTGMEADGIYAATGFQFADALTGSVLAAKELKPIVLVRHDRIPPEVITFLNGASPEVISILGGTAAISKEVGYHLRKFLDQ
ncbi:cell wall-binding repeat-containing protein [Halobacillus sp. BAB-2008]|uniref:cell wall-binding repeat-containing protein n=1 Tax=Halobacillus sp. BAB-2008 TaxID=1246484 RepID=UPI0002A4E5BC|nr:cell wall-binding repeat-containing protein [Halobacillus sp. BAB-2008]ELK46390.1 alkaline serine protease, subtilase family protein [Halobacillus sp. BAB-2008]